MLLGVNLGLIEVGESVLPCGVPVSTKQSLKEQITSRLGRVKFDPLKNACLVGKCVAAQEMLVLDAFGAFVLEILT